MCLFLQIVSGQGLYVGPNANLFVHSDSVGIFSNFSNFGNFGSKPGAVIRFMGQLWSNDRIASIADENSYPGNISIPTIFSGTGGLIWFSSLNNSLSQSQLISGGYIVGSHTGPGFPNLRIDNPLGVFMLGEDMQVRNVLDLASGKLWLNDNNLLLGSVKPGTITGYNKSRYVVTGADTTGGFLYFARLDSSSGQIIFPVGADTTYYTPVAITYKGTAQDFKVRPFNQIYSNAISGSTADQSFVQTIWNIGKQDNENAETDIVMQHPKLLEGTIFASKRDSSYITRYDNVRAIWDTVPATGVHQPGRLTTDSPEDSTFENVRAFIMALSPNEYFAKTASITSGVIAGLGLANNLDELLAHEDGSFDVSLTMVVQNNGKDNLHNLLISNNLFRTFTSAASINMLSLKASGKLFINLGYDGLSSGDTMLLLPSSLLEIGKIDTINLKINVNPGYLTGIFYNQAHASGVTTITGYQIFTNSVDGLDPNGLTGRTPITLRKLNVRIPKGFSPNGDGVNDKYELDSTVNYNVSMEIFNRWGQKVFKSNGIYYNDWDGTSNQPGPFLNKKLEDGTYFYFITLTDKLSGEIKKAVGYLTLRR